MFIADWTWSFYHISLGEKPAILKISVDVIRKSNFQPSCYVLILMDS